MWKKSKIFTTNMWLRHNSIKGAVRLPIQGAVCADGTHISIQGAGGYYCSPKNDLLPKGSVEILLDTDDLPEYMTGHVNEQHGGCSLCGWIPVRIVDQFISEHGGIINL